MNTLAKYTIAHKGLGIGIHHFEFDADNRFFEAFDGSEIQTGRVHVKIELNKQSSNLLTLKFTVTGEVSIACDRCLETFDLPIDYTGTLYVRYSETEQESDGEILWISPAETEITVAQYIYESICLSLPYQRIHPTDENGISGCDPEMLQRFNIVSEEEFERITQPTQEQGSPWSKLEILKQESEK